MARKIWLFYAIATVAAGLVLLALYVNAYDDYDIGDRLRGVGRFARRAMTLLSFPLGPSVGLLADEPLERAFGCGDPNEPCAFFVHWNTRFAALVAQIGLLRWAVARGR
ncbi:hypothetical protein ACNHKD_18895 [Methylocystis sp. JAN1]|uniref:hypothetical protein n=1 Tax=Methylocystis sp. JAN1 TaxID=3397211 RepID=UPI003FA2399D